MAEAASSLLSPVTVAFPVEIDQEAGSVKQTHCRVCLRSDGRDLISPCKCDGPYKFVHRQCLDNDRATKEPFAFAHCTTCKALYYLRGHIRPAVKWKIIKFLKFRYTLFLFAVTQLVTWLLGNILFLVSNNQHYVHMHYFSWYRRYYVGVDDDEFTWLQLYYGLFEVGGPANVYYNFGVLLFCFILALSGCFVTCYRRIRNGPAESCHSSMNRWMDCTTLFGSNVNKAVECEFIGEVDQLWLQLLLIMELVVVPFHMIIGIFSAILLSSVFGLLIWKYHYCVRAKILLAREYVVDDIDGEIKDWCPPPLPPDQAQELKKLGLL